MKETKMTVGEETSINEVLSVLKGIVIAVATELLGRVHRDRRKGSAWWTGKTKDVIEVTKRTYKKIWQRKGK